MKKNYKFISLILMLVFSLLPGRLSGIEKKVLLPDNSVGRKGKILSNTIMVRFKKEYTGQLALSAGIQGFPQAGNLLNIPGASIERPVLHPKSSLTFNSNRNKQNNTLSATKMNKIIAAEEPLLRTFVVEYTGNTAPEKFCQKLIENNPAIELAEPYYLHKQMSHIPDDPKASNQSALQVIGAFDVWDNADMRGDTSIIIGISDGGINQAHEDLHDNIAPNWEEIPNNGRDDDSNGYVDDYLGCNLSRLRDNRSGGDTYNTDSHGTLVAGIAAAHTNNKKGIAAPGYNSRLFPIKISDFGDSDLYNSYESFIYAGVRGVKVLNCSWGASTYEYSDMHQSMINYAVARDVAIVAAGGNLEGEPENSVFWPANYDGVLGVGEVNLEDVYHNGSAKGPQIDIVANADNLTVGSSGNSEYRQSGHGTSFAAPLVSGCVALIRAKYPELDALQAIEYTRQCSDDITDKNFQYKNVIPGRINLRKALEIEPFSIPSIRPLGKTLKTWINRRYDLYDTVDLYIDVKNYLGAYDNLTFTLSPIEENQSMIRIISDTVRKQHIDKDEQFALGPFKVRIDTDYDLKMILRVDVFNNETGYRDFFLFHFIPQPVIATFSNDVLEFSVSDEGLLGYNTDDFYYKYGSSLVYDGDRRWYEGGLIMTEESSLKVVSTVSFSNYNAARLDVVKPFYKPDNIGIVSDLNQSESNKIGLEIKQDYTIASGNNAFYKLKVTATNKSQYVKQGVSVGYYLDWDIGIHYDSNYIMLYPEGIPDNLDTDHAGIELITDADHSPLFAFMVFSEDASAVPQLQGAFGGPGDLLEALNSGTANQTDPDELGDVNMIAGIKFTDEWQPEEDKEFFVCMCAGKTEDELKKNLRNCALGNSVKEQAFSGSGLSISPQPAAGELLVRLNSSLQGNAAINIYNLLGSQSIPGMQRFIIAGNNDLKIDIGNLSPGIYFIQVRIEGNIYSQQFIVGE